MLLTIAVIFSIAIYAFGSAYDIEQTLLGLSKGLAEEANTFLVGSHPSEKALVLRDAVVLFLMLMLGFFVHPVLLISSATVGGLVHLRGALRWHVLLKGGKLTELNSAWRKFLGF